MYNKEWYKCNGAEMVRRVLREKYSKLKRGK
jgi:hypothetical protein